MLNVVFLPGVNNVASLWDPVVRAVSLPINPVPLDLPALESVEEIAQELSGALPQEFVLVGHSFGGMVGLALLEAFPERVRAIALVASRAGADAPELRQAKLDRAELARREGHEQFVLGRADRVFHPDYLHDQRLLEQRAEHVRGYGTERYVAHQIAMANRPDRRDVLRAAEIPKLIVAPGADLVISSDYQLALAKDVEADLSIIENTGHMLPAENPARLGEELDTWLRSISGTSH